MAKPIYTTQEGYNKMKEELKLLKGEKRAEIVERLKVARSYGDLSENSEYDAAKNEQAVLEARIAELDATLKNAVIIKEDEMTSSHVRIGHTVKVENLTLHKEITYRIVSSIEAKPLQNIISDESPIGSALLNHAVGDIVEVEVPAGARAFKILDISFMENGE